MTISKETKMTEEKIKQMVCPQLSMGKESTVNCIGRGCVSFTVTATHIQEKVTVVADPEKLEKIQDVRKMALDSSSHGLFVNSSLKWNTEVDYEGDFYKLEGPADQNVNDTGHIAVYNAEIAIKTENGALSCHGYCHLNMENDNVVE